PHHFRDPFVFYDQARGCFVMLVTAQRTDYPLAGYGNCLAQLVSPDLQRWTLVEPFLIPGFPDAPECPDYFVWNGWHYLIFSNGLQARYRMARSSHGPWLRPALDLLDGPWGRVMKTAPYHDNRRIGVAWLGTRAGDADDGKLQWGGHAVFRELVQQADGTLGSKFVPEMALPAGAPLSLPIQAMTPGATVEPGRIALDAPEGLAAAAISGVPHNAHIRLTVAPAPQARRFGLRLRAANGLTGGYPLEIEPDARRVALYDAILCPLPALDAPATLEIVLYDDIIDLCLNERHCLINRCPGQHGDQLTFFCHNGAAVFSDIIITSLSSVPDWRKSETDGETLRDGGAN
ncbi:MAG TPA: hypothetical protein VNK95_19260, partial [Caldilineaceae bacterium]|nr:hypothetical protein [Caldilineaceae bacterium]